MACMYIAYNCAEYLSTRSYSMTLLLATDDLGEVFIDGKKVCSTTGRVTSVITFSSFSRLIAVDVYNQHFFGGLIAEFSTGMKSDESWKCTRNKPSE